MQHIIETARERAEFVESLYNDWKYPYTVEIKKGKRRTLQQNNSLHLYCTQMAQALNEAGFDMRAFFNETDYAEAPWSCETFKEYIWRPVQKALTQKESTTEMSTVEPTDIHMVVDKKIAEITGVSFPWPSREGMDGF